jgi:hypothetical protein
MLFIYLIIFTVNKAWYLGAILQKLKKLNFEQWGFLISEPNPIFKKIKEFMILSTFVKTHPTFVLRLFWSNVN